MKLNLGCGQNLLPGYVNVDRDGDPDQRVDLETFPWPWDDSTCEEVVLNHVLEHLGQRTDEFLRIICELYRVCAPAAVVKILVPHPRHDAFLNDPTHVRPITPDTLSMLSRAKCREWRERKVANTPLADYLDVDFELIQSTLNLDEPWLSQLRTGAITETDAHDAVRRFNNVASSIYMELRVIKPKTES